MESSPYWTKPATKRLRDAFLYIAVNYYMDYAVAFRNDVLNTAAEIPAMPQIGVEAFPTLCRPRYRKILCRNRNWWIYYRIEKDRIEILSVRNCLMRIDTLRQL